MISKMKYGSHEEWLDIRSRYIGGSDASAVVGMNLYKSAYSLWAEKSGKLQSFTGNVTTQVGAYLEDFVAQMFTEKTGKKVRKSNFTYINDKYPFACANVDRFIVGEDAILEIKTTNSLPNMKKIRSGDYPETYLCQMTHYLAVTGAKKAYLAVLVACREFYVFELERDEDEIKALMDAEREFWTHVEDGTPPPVDGSESTGDTVSQIYGESDGSDCDLAGYEADLREYIELGGQIKALKELQNQAANRVKVFMGESARGQSASYKVVWSNSVRRAFDSKKYIAEHPGEDFGGYYNETNTRTFRVTERR